MLNSTAEGQLKVIQRILLNSTAEGQLKVIQRILLNSTAEGQLKVIQRILLNSTAEGQLKVIQRILLNSTAEGQLKVIQRILLNSSYPTLTRYENIVAAFRGMHVLPAKHSYRCVTTKKVSLPDRQTDAGQNDPYVPLCITGDTKMSDYMSSSCFILHNNSIPQISSKYSETHL